MLASRVRCESFFPATLSTPHKKWAGGQLKNGALLQAVEPQFDAFLTSDENLKYQQYTIGRRLAILVLPTNDWPTLRRMVDKISTTVTALKPGDFLEMPPP